MPNKKFDGTYAQADEGSLPVMTVVIVVQDIRFCKSATRTLNLLTPVGLKPAPRLLLKLARRELENAFKNVADQVKQAEVANG